METQFKDLLFRAQAADCLRYSLEQIGQLMPRLFTPEVLRAIDAELATIV